MTPAQKAARKIFKAFNMYYSYSPADGMHKIGAPEILETHERIIQQAIDEANAWQPIETAPKKMELSFWYVNKKNGKNVGGAAMTMLAGLRTKQKNI